MKKIILIVSFMITFMLGGCVNSTVEANQDRPLKISYQNKGGNLQTYNIVDETTNVHYVVVAQLSSRGGVAICPRYNADGTLYTGEGE